MKLFFAIVIAALLLGCKSNKKFTITNEIGTTTAAFDAGEMVASADYIIKKEEELRKLKPLTQDQLSALLPNEIKGFKLIGSDTELGDQMIEASYSRDNDSDNEVSLTVQDCAGKEGMSWFFLAGISMQVKNEKVNTRIIDFMGEKAMETVFKDGGAMLNYMVNDRLHIVLSSEKADIETLKDVAKSLRLKI